MSQTRYESDVGQTRCKESIRAIFRVCTCSLDHLTDHGVVILLARSLEKDVCPSIDEKTDTGCVSSLPRSPDTIGLLDFFSELSIIGRKAILQVAAYCPGLDCKTDSLVDSFRRIAIAAFQIDRHG